MTPHFVQVRRSRFTPKWLTLRLYAGFVHQRAEFDDQEEAEKEAARWAEFWKVEQKETLTKG